MGFELEPESVIVGTVLHEMIYALQLLVSDHWPYSEGRQKVNFICPRPLLGTSQGKEALETKPAINVPIQLMIVLMVGKRWFNMIFGKESRLESAHKNLFRLCICGLPKHEENLLSLARPSHSSRKSS